MNDRNTRVIVLGASGFIGRWIARTLPEHAQTYLVVRDLAVSEKLMTAYHAKGTLAQVNLTNFSEIEKLFSYVKPAIVFNLAGYGVDPGERDPQLANQMNAELPRVLCKLIKSHHDSAWTGQHLIQAGSALEYGTAKGTLSEEVTPQPTTLYGISKLAGTKAVLNSDLRALVLRFFNVYGPGEHAGRLLPSLIETAATYKDLDLTPGTQKRDFTYVEDVAQGTIQLGLHAEKLHTPVHLATGNLHSVREFTEIASRVLKIQPHRLHFGKLPFRQEEMDHEGISVERLKELVKWTPSTSIEQGVRRTIAFLEQLAQ